MLATYRTATIEDDKELLKPIEEPILHLDKLNKKIIRSSPYQGKKHRLDLTTLPSEYRILGLALLSFKPLSRELYAFEPYIKAFNIEQIFRLVSGYFSHIGIKFRHTRIHVIAFGSILHQQVKESAEGRKLLAQIDKRSHVEANKSGGLLKYWFGTPDIYGKNLATCWWVDKESAEKGGKCKSHREGMKIVRDWFACWEIKEYELII